MPTITKYAGDKITVKAGLKNAGETINNLCIAVKLASPYVSYRIYASPSGKVVTGQEVDWTLEFNVGSDWLSYDYTLVIELFDRGFEEGNKFQEFITDWTITIIVPPT